MHYISMLNNFYSNYHFEEHVKEDDVLFDFKLRKGSANSRNAIKLLNMIGYDEDIIRNADNKVVDFLNTGIWKIIE